MSASSPPFELPKPPPLAEEDLKAVRSFLPGKLLGRMAAFLGLILLVLAYTASLVFYQVASRIWPELA